MCLSPQPVCFPTWESCRWGAVALQEHGAAVAEVGWVVGTVFFASCLNFPPPWCEWRLLAVEVPYAVWLG